MSCSWMEGMNELMNQLREETQEEIMYRIA